MTISDNYVPVKELGDGVTTQFSGAWNPISAEYIIVYLEDVATGVQTLVDPNDYTVTANTNGFIVTMDTAPTSSYYIVIGRNVAQTQTDPYKTSVGFQGKVIENSFDKLTAITQDLQDAVSRSLTAPLGNEDISLGSPSDRGVTYWDGGELKSDLLTIEEAIAGVTGPQGPQGPVGPAATFPLVAAISDEITNLTTGTAKLTFRAPVGMTITSVRASLTAASSSGLPTFDINKNGASILSTKITIDANEKTSLTAATQPVLSSTTLALDDEITIDIDVAGTGAKGAKIYIMGSIA